MYLARFSYDVLPANRQRAIDLIRQEVEAARKEGRNARLLVPLTRGQGGAALSADGRAAAFASVATNLVPHDRNGPLEDVFVRVLNDRPGGREVASAVMPGG